MNRVPTKRCGKEYGGFEIVQGIDKTKKVVYSFGIGEGPSFNKDIMNRFDCEIYNLIPFRNPPSIKKTFNG